MSVSISEKNFQYVGILNGVMYRIDPTSGRSVEPMSGSQPLAKWSDHAKTDASAHPAAAVVPSVSAPPVIEAAAEAQAVSVRRVALPSTLFPRGGAEPLRAGHPDLWALLVDGTSLEGSTFSSL
jgi:hypothetical protein